PVGTVSILRGVKYRGNAHAVAISPDGHWLAAGSGEQNAKGPNSVRLWDLTAANPASTEKVLRDHSGRVLSAAFSPDGDWLATGSTEGIWLWDLTAENPLDKSKALPAEKGSVLSFAFSPNSRRILARIASGSKRRQVSPREFVGSSRL